MADPLDERPTAVAFFLADHAAVENGKVYASGAFWNRLAGGGFPSVHHFSVATVLDVPWSAHGRSYQFGVRFEDADGQAVGPRVDGEFEVGTPPGLRVGDTSIVPFAARVDGLLLEQAGDYSAILEIDGEIAARWQFQAVELSV